MKDIIITDAKYRSSLAAVQALGGKQFNIILCQSDDYKKTPLSFSSKYVKQSLFLDAENYENELLELVKKYDMPVILPIGAKTTEILSKSRDRFKPYCYFIVPSPQVLDDANSKKTMTAIASQLNIPVPAQYTGDPEEYPVIIKPSCGEKFGLAADQRYIKANNKKEYLTALEKMKKFDPSPIVQKCIKGDAVGVCVVMNENSEAVSLICHQRIRELPISGGPSTCCRTVTDKQLIDYSLSLLKKIGFCGVAMVEFKGGCFLEINPRVWGSFPLTYKSQSNFTQNWVNCALSVKTSEPYYKLNVKMNFTANDILCALKSLAKGKINVFLSVIFDILNPFVKEAIFSFQDPKPFFTYIKNLFTRG